MSPVVNHRILLLTTAAFVVVPAMVIVATMNRPVRHCGHVKTWTECLSLVKMTHCCESGANLSRLYSIAMAVAAFRRDHGADRFPESLAELYPEYLAFPTDRRFRYRRLEEAFEISVDPTHSGGIGYLLTGEGVVHFNREGSATREDRTLP